MGTQDMSPLPAGLIKLLKNADALVVEADISGHESPFAGLESDRPLAERLSEAQLTELTRLAEKLPALSLHHVRAREYRGDLVLLHELGDGPTNASQFRVGSLWHLGAQ